jgi:hypothetical protein
VSSTHLGLKTIFVFLSYSCGFVEVGRPLRRQALTSAVILGSESRGTHDHILLSQVRDSSNLDGQVPVFISPRNRVARLYPHALGSLFVASYVSQGYGGGILALNRICSPGTDRTEDVSSIIARSLVTGETTCPQSCSLASPVILSPVYAAVTWQWLYISHYLRLPVLSELWCGAAEENHEMLRVEYPGLLPRFEPIASRIRLFDSCRGANPL